MSERQTKQSPTVTEKPQRSSSAATEPTTGEPPKRRQDQPSRDRVDSPEKIEPGDREHGEGNYKASREYNEATEKFVKSGRVDAAAGNAAPESEEEAREMEAAERTGRERAQEEDPEISQPKQQGGRH